MSTLQEILDSIQGQVTFDLGQTTIRDGVVISRSYSSNPNEIITLEQLRDIFRNQKADNPEVEQARAAVLIVPDKLRKELVNHLRALLVDYIDNRTDRIGYAMPTFDSGGYQRHRGLLNGLYSISSISNLSVFAEGLLRGTAMLGSQTVARYLSQWIEGQPLKYRTSTLLNGLTIEQPVTITDGIRVNPLPLSTDQLPAYLPKRNDVSARDYLGHAVLSIDSTASPALFNPGANEAVQQVDVSAVDNADFSIICETLSLESNRNVEPAFYWNDYGELMSYARTNSIESWSTGSTKLEHSSYAGWSTHTDLATGVTTLTLNSNSITSLSKHEVQTTLKALQTLTPQTRTAVSRWMKSKKSGDGIVDSFIDLRIALEALYLKDFLNEYSQEMRFRLALFGAWHLGNSFNERKGIRKTLRDAYDRASQAVHGDDIAFSTENRRLLFDAQALCRQGILKLLREGFPQDWGDLVLGIEDDC